MIDQISMETDAQHRRTTAEQRAERGRRIRAARRSSPVEPAGDAGSARSASPAPRGIRLAGWLAWRRLGAAGAR